MATTYVNCSECGHGHFVIEDNAYDVCLVDGCTCPFAAGEYPLTSASLTTRCPSAVDVALADIPSLSVPWSR